MTLILFAQIVFFSIVIKEQYSYTNRKKKNQSEKKNLRLKDIYRSCQPNCQHQELTESLSYAKTIDNFWMNGRIFDIFFFKQLKIEPLL